jgi:hypothetical protein
MKSGITLPLLGTKGRNAKKKLKLRFYGNNNNNNKNNNNNPVSPFSDNKTRQYSTKTGHEAASGHDL